MSFFSDLQASLDSLRATLGDDIEARDVPAAMRRLRDETVAQLIVDATVLVRTGECVRITASGVVASRSARETGHEGMAQVRGHRNAISLIQDLTGTTRADATKQVRLGEALLEAAMSLTPEPAPDPEAGDGMSGEMSVPRVEPVRPWHAVLSDAYLAGRLTKDKQDAIRRGLGEPPRASSDATGVRSAADAAARDAATVSAWAAAAEQLIAEARQRNADELLKAARSVRDLLDPRGAADRFDQRLQQRSFRMWIDDEGGHHARIDFDDGMAAWVRAIIDTALRPRRGGPRFVDADEKARAAELEADHRTNDQLTYDLMMDVLRAGALADANEVFGSRQPGLRIVVSAEAHDDEHAGVPAVAVLEDDSTALPAWLAAQHSCDTGTIECTVDREGNPLDLGREERLFSTKQKLVLAIRDGGCRWENCDRPASYCESHHVDPYADGGRTDVDRGILLCRWHHMELHHGGWRITRDGRADFVLHPPPGRGAPIVLTARLARKYALGDLQPPPRRFRVAA